MLIMMRINEVLWIAVVVTVTVLALSTEAVAHSSYVTWWQAKYGPSTVVGSSSLNSIGGTGCGLCHGSNSDTTHWNSYGRQLILNGLPCCTPTGTNQNTFNDALINVEGMNSASDTNTFHNI